MLWAWLALAVLGAFWLALLLWTVVLRHVPWEGLGPIHLWLPRRRGAARALVLSAAALLFAAWQWSANRPLLLVGAVVILVAGLGLAILPRLAVCEAGVMLGASFYPWSQIRSCCIHKDRRVEFVTPHARVPLHQPNEYWVLQPSNEQCDRLCAVLQRLKVEVRDDRV